MLMAARVFKLIFGIFAFWLISYILKDVLIEFAPAWLKQIFAIGIVTSVLVILFMIVLMMLGYVRKAWMVRPDERGNLPILMPLLWGKPRNLNLAGADESPMAWALWQQTNNGQGVRLSSPLPSPEQFQVEQPAVYALMAGQSNVIDSVAEDL